VIVTAAAYVIGILLILVSYSEAKSSVSSTHFDVFWAGFSLLLTSSLYLGTRKWLPRIGAVLVLASYGIVTFLPKFLMSASGPIYYDEYGHFRHANELLANGNLFNPDPYLYIVKYYPGLSALTVALHELTRLSIWHSGQLIVLAAHCGVLITIFLICRTIGLSQGASVTAGLVYSLNSSYVYFDTQYAYESLALPLAIFVVLACIRAVSTADRNGTIRWALVGSVVAAMCVITHHLSSAFMAGMCLAVMVRLPRSRSTSDDRRYGALWGGWAITGTAVIGVALWTGIVARPVISYIWPHVYAGLKELVQRGAPAAQPSSGGGATGPPGAHSLFSGSGVPPYEKGAAFASVVFVLIMFVLTAVALWRSTRSSVKHSHSIREKLGNINALQPVGRRLILVSVVLTVLYFVSLPIALTSGGGEAAHRSWGYTYFGVAVVSACFVEFVLPTLSVKIWYPILLSAALLVMAVIVGVGNIAAGESIYYRFPGPYQFGTDTRSNTPELDVAVRWMNENLPAGSAVVTDRFSGERLTAYSRLNIPSASQWEVYNLYRMGAHPTLELRRVLKADHFNYFLLDKRIERDIPVNKLFEDYEGPSSINVAALKEMGSNSFASIMFESPNYVVFALHP
jgi:hypothetical protein